MGEDILERVKEVYAEFLNADITKEEYKDKIYEIVTEEIYSWEGIDYQI